MIFFWLLLVRFENFMCKLWELIICFYCWYCFVFEDVYWEFEYVELCGDLVCGLDVLFCFLLICYDVNGCVVDGGG